MFILQIEHPVPDFNGWKKAFDSVSHTSSIFTLLIMAKEKLLLWTSAVYDNEQCN